MMQQCCRFPESYSGWCLNCSEDHHKPNMMHAQQSLQIPLFSMCTHLVLDPRANVYKDGNKFNNQWANCDIKMKQMLAKAALVPLCSAIDARCLLHICQKMHSISEERKKTIKKSESWHWKALQTLSELCSKDYTPFTKTKMGHHSAKIPSTILSLSQRNKQQ